MYPSYSDPFHVWTTSRRARLRRPRRTSPPLSLSSSNTSVASRVARSIWRENRTVYVIARPSAPYNLHLSQGRYIPTFAAAVYDQNAKLAAAGLTPINLTSAMIGVFPSYAATVTISDRQLQGTDVQTGRLCFRPTTTCSASPRASIPLWTSRKHCNICSNRD